MKTMIRLFKHMAAKPDSSKDCKHNECVYREKNFQPDLKMKGTTFERMGAILAIYQRGRP